MIDQARIQQIVKRLIKSSSVEERQAINPPREWAFGIWLTLVGVGVGGAVSYLSYLNTLSVEVVPDAVSVESAAYSGVVVEEAAIRFRERAARFAALRAVGGSPAPVPDPVPVETETTPPPTEAELPAADPVTPEAPGEDTPVEESSNQTPQVSF